MKHWIFILSIGLISACSDRRCDLGSPAYGLMNCTTIFGGEYKACHGPVWDESVTNYCEDYDHYSISLEMIFSETRTVIVNEAEIELHGSLEVQDWHNFNEKILQVDEVNKEACFNVSDPPVCFVAKNPMADMPASDITRPHVR